MKSHIQPSDIDQGQLRSVCRHGAPCCKLDFRSDDEGARIITCSRNTEVKHPSEINTGEQHKTCTYKIPVPVRMSIAGLSLITGALSK